MASKYSVINTLTHRVKSLCSTPQLLDKEFLHLEEVLMRCRYPKWAIIKVLHNQEGTKKSNSRKQIPTVNQIDKRCHLAVPYSPGLYESYKTICNRYVTQVHFKGGQTLKILPVFPKNKDTITKQSSVIYWFKCDKTECDEEYIEELSRTFGERYKEHLKAPSPIFEHQNTTDHITAVDSFQFIGNEGHNMARAMKEAVYI